MSIDIQSIVVCSDNGKIIEGNWTTINDMVMKFTKSNNVNFSEPNNFIHIHYMLRENGNVEKANVVLEVKNINQTNNFTFNFHMVAFTKRLDDVKDIVVKPIGDKTISLEWTDLMLDEQSFERYQIYIDNVLMMDSFKNNVSFSPQTIGQHTYKVLAVNNMGITTRTTNDSVVTVKMSDVLNQSKEKTKLERPLNVRRTIRNNAVIVSWDTPRNNSKITSYWVFFKVNGKNKRVRVIANNKSKTQSTTFYYLNPNVNYEVFVVSVDTNNNTSINSNSVFTKQSTKNTSGTIRERLLPPKNIRYEMINERKIRIYWNVTTNNVDNYSIYSQTSEEIKLIKKIKVFDSKQSIYSFDYEIPLLNTSYLFYITSVSLSNIESKPSEKISVLIKKEIRDLEEEYGNNVIVNLNDEFFNLESLSFSSNNDQSAIIMNNTIGFGLRSIDYSNVMKIPQNLLIDGKFFKEGNKTYYRFNYFDDDKDNYVVAGGQLLKRQIPLGYKNQRNGFDFINDVSEIKVITRNNKGLFVAGNVGNKSLSHFFVDVTKPPYNLLGGNTEKPWSKEPRWVLMGVADKLLLLDNWLKEKFKVSYFSHAGRKYDYDETYRLFINSAYRPNFKQASLYYDYYYLKKGQFASQSPFLSTHTMGIAVDISIAIVQTNVQTKSSSIADRRSLKKMNNVFYSLWEKAIDMGFENAGARFSTRKSPRAIPDIDEHHHFELPFRNITNTMLPADRKNG